jgi:hypothetical protein
MPRDDRLRKLIDRLQNPVMTWLIRREEAREVVGDPRRGQPLRDRPSWRTGQEHVFRLDVDTGRRYAIVQLVRESELQLIVAASATTSSCTVVEPGPA